MRRNFIRFVLIGLSATLSHVIIALILYDGLKLPVQVANTVAFLFAVLLSYTGNKLWTFQSKLSHKSAFPKFFILSCLSYLVNLLIVFVVVNLLQQPFWIALAFIVSIIPVMNFFIAKKMVFHEK